MSRDNNKTLNIQLDVEKTIPISLVNRALEELTNRASVGVQKQQKMSLDRICKALVDRDEKPSAIIISMLESGISVREVFEVFIPDAARQLGNCWVRNTLTFTEVTLATSRLQTIAREFEQLYIGSINSGAAGPEIMVISPKGEQHTFGAQMICRQFKRLGAFPYLSIDNSLPEIKKIVSKHKFELVGLSLADYKLCSKHGEVRTIIKFIKKLKIPIIAGGSLIRSQKNIVKSLGVDMITNDATSVLRYLDLNFATNKESLDLVTN